MLEQRLAVASGLTPNGIAIVLCLVEHQPASIPDVAAGAGRQYSWAKSGLAALRESGWVIRCSAAPNRYALSDAGLELADGLGVAAQQAIASVLGWPAGVVTERALDVLATRATDVERLVVRAESAALSDVAVVAECLGVEQRVVGAWVRSGSVSAPPWTEDNLEAMRGLRGSVIAVWPELLAGARAGGKFSLVTAGLGITTQRVASAIGRDPVLRTQLDDALMLGRDPAIQHGRRLAYRDGCWCPECRRAQLGH